MVERLDRHHQKPVQNRGKAVRLIGGQYPEAMIRTEWKRQVLIAKLLRVFRLKDSMQEGERVLVDVDGRHLADFIDHEER